MAMSRDDNEIMTSPMKKKNDKEKKNTMTTEMTMKPNENETK